MRTTILKNALLQNGVELSVRYDTLNEQHRSGHRADQPMLKQHSAAAYAAPVVPSTSLGHKCTLVYMHALWRSHAMGAANGTAPSHGVSLGGIVQIVHAACVI